MIPASSPSLRSSTSTLKPFRSAQRVYMRMSICAQSCASVPPAPAAISTWASRMVGLAAKQRPELESLELGLELLRLALDLALHVIVGLGGEHLFELERALHAGGERARKARPTP